MQSPPRTKASPASNITIQTPSTTAFPDEIPSSPTPNHQTGHPDEIISRQAAIMAGAEETQLYRPTDAINATIKTTLLTGTAGLFTSAVQNTLHKQNVGPWGIFTRTGGTIVLFASMGGTYQFVKTASANLREKDDHWNTVWGGLCSGSIIGLRARTFPAMVGYGVALATVLGIFDYTGGSLSGRGVNPDIDEYERRKALRTNYRTPGEQTIAELGEGRGIEGPGYAERRRDRIKQNYGIDVPVTQASASAS
ncbi:hypothetical protein FQN57_000406 [Myotisia sp. PD_48]|nr:hypothetical protein FQN57_000406 [Myotisia sp. PD_48]